MKKLCNDKIPTHKKASKILKQLKENPEVCETCGIKPCTFGKYVWG